MRRIHALSARDQIEAHRVLSQHLGGGLGDETELTRQARERRGALEATGRLHALE
jgi:hypothetical protein